MIENVAEIATTYWRWVALLQGDRSDRLLAEAMNRDHIDAGTDVDGLILAGGEDAIVLLGALAEAAPADQLSTSLLGAGPLETFLSNNSDDESAIESLYILLRRTPRLRAALSHVWCDVPERIAELR